MKSLIIIRVCKRDEHLALRCYHTLLEKIPNIEIIIFADAEEYNTFGDSEFNMWYHPSYDNYGGRDNVLPYIKKLKEINIQNYKYVVIVDSDIQILKNPLEHEFDFGGIQDDNNKRHFSGQLLIFKSELLQKVLDYNNIYELTEDFVNKNISVADDTILSWIATEYTTNTYNFFNQNYWIHSKQI